MDSMTGLQTARILSARGVAVYGVASDVRHPCCRTRSCRAVLRADTAGEELIDLLVRLGARLDQKAVLVPCTDTSVLSISRWRARLADAYHIPLPADDTVELLTDKARFAAHAARLGLPAPPTRILRDRRDAEDAAASLRFPCMLKPPVKTPRWESGSREKVHKVDGPTELLAVYDELAPLAEVLVAQEWIGGSEGDHFTCNAYFDRRSRPLVTFVTRKIRQWPPQTGAACLAIEARNEAVRDATIRVFSGAGFWGLGYLELKRDARTGNHLIIEPNVGRPTGRSASAEAAGVELLYAMYCDVTGLPLPADRLEQRYRGTKWIYFGRDVRAAFYHWRRGDLTVAEWARSLRGPITDAVFSWRDPVPFCLDALRGFGLLRAGVRRLGRLGDRGA
jgi:predicted ATP-grasp superfamily ATP-dependent carboligase